MKKKGTNLLKIINPTVTINIPITMATPATIATAIPEKKKGSLITHSILHSQHDIILDSMQSYFFDLGLFSGRRYYVTLHINFSHSGIGYNF